jgi:glycosyltransferase involved in cell wall biosynthesis
MKLSKKSPFDAAMMFGRDSAISVDYLSLKSFSVFSYIARAIKSLFFLNNYDIVFTDDLFLPLFRIICRWKKPHLLMLLERSHKNTISDIIFLPFMRICVKKVDKILCLSSLQVLEHSLFLKMPPSRIASSLYGIDSNFFKKRNSRDDIILCVGDAYRDDKTLIMATKDIPLTLVRVSDNSPTLANFRNLVDTLVASDKKNKFISFCRVTEFQLRELYDLSRIIIVPVLPSTPQPAGLTAVLEGMAMSKPVITSGRLNAYGYVVHGKTGIIVEPNNVEALASAILTLLNDPYYCKTIGNEARNSIEQYFTIEQFSSRLSTILSSLNS